MRSVPHDNLATTQRSLWRSCSPLFVVPLALLASLRAVEGGEPSTLEAQQAAADWVQDALVVAMPAAAVGGCQAGIYTPAVNGVQPWRQAIIRWLTGRHVMGNTAILVRQEASEGGAGLSAVIDPNAEYRFQVNVMLPGIGFGERPKEDPPLWITVLDCSDRVIAESPAHLAPGKWSSSEVVFHSGLAREVRCVVRGMSPKQLPCFYFIDDFRLARDDQWWWSPQNLFDAVRTAVRLRDGRNLLCRTLDPDVVGGHNGVYLNWDGFFTRRGIAVGGGQWEQEYNHVAADDPSADRFLDNGVSRNLQGQPVLQTDLWPGYSMCHNAPEWHLYQQQRLARIAPEVQLLSQDNVSCPSFMYGRTCFCRWCREGFRQWLRKRFNAEQFRAAGIADPAAFDVAQYVKDQQARISQGREAVLADPVLRAFIQFQYASQLDRWRDTVAAVKKAAGHPLAVCGNQGGANGQLPYSVALSQIGDAIPVETWSGRLTPQSRAWDALGCQLGLAAGQYRRPVWLWMTSLMNAAEAARSRLRLSAAQAWADGGVPIPWATAPGASGWFYDEEAGLCRFAQRQRALLARRDRCANVGLVYSLPTHAWRKFPAFKLSSEPYTRWFGAWARLLQEAHVPYEVNCWWHPLLGDDRVSLERLARYRVLVLPGVDCFSDAQRKAVRAFQAGGGRVVAVTIPKCCDADGVPRPAGQTLAAPGDPLIEVAPALLTRYARTGGQSPPETAADGQAAAQELLAIVRRAIGDDPMLDTDAPADVWADVWLDDTRRVLALHLVNGNIDAAADRFRPVERSRWRVRLPEGLSVDRAMAITPDEADESAQAKPLGVVVAAGWATVVLPRIERYTVVALYAGEALTAANNLAHVRRALWQASVIHGGRLAPTIDTQLEHVLSLLRAGRLEAGAAAAADLLKLLSIHTTH